MENKQTMKFGKSKELSSPKSITNAGKTNPAHAKKTTSTAKTEASSSPVSLMIASPEGIFEEAGPIVLPEQKRGSSESGPSTNHSKENAPRNTFSYT